MRRPAIIITVIALAVLVGSAPGASVQTAAMVELVPPMAASLAAPVADGGASTWLIDAADHDRWQVSLEARDHAGRILAVEQPLDGNPPTTDQVLTAFAAPADPSGDTPMVLTLVLCRE